MKAALPTSPEVYTDLQGLSQLRREASTDKQSALRKVANQFEALFMQMMLKRMRDAQLADGMFDSDQTRFYQEMYDKQIALTLSRQGSMGLADTLVKQLGGKVGTEGEVESATAASSKSLPVPAERASLGNATRYRPPASPQAFIAELWPHAERAGESLGVDPRAILSQVALETGWGKSVIRNADGSSSHNVFGIKAGRSWTGQRAVVSTLEYENGAASRRRDAFRSYPSYQAAFNDYVTFLRGNPRYSEAVRAASEGEAGAFLRGLQSGGYATDPAYADKILSVFHGDTLNNALSALKVFGERSIA